ADREAVDPTTPGLTPAQAPAGWPEAGAHLPPPVPSRGTSLVFLPAALSDSSCLCGYIALSRLLPGPSHHRSGLSLIHGVGVVRLLGLGRALGRGEPARRQKGRDKRQEQQQENVGKRGRLKGVEGVPPARGGFLARCEQGSSNRRTCGSQQKA